MWGKKLKLWCLLWCSMLAGTAWLSRLINLRWDESDALLYCHCMSKFKCKCFTQGFISGSSVIFQVNEVLRKIVSHDLVCCKHLTLSNTCRDFINIFIRRATAFRKRTKLSTELSGRWSNQPDKILLTAVQFTLVRSLKWNKLHKVNLLRLWIWFSTTF